MGAVHTPQPSLHTPQPSLHPCILLQRAVHARVQAPTVLLQPSNLYALALPLLSSPRYCYDRGYLQCLWECGGTLAAPAIAGGAIHKTMAFVAPKLVSLGPGGDAA